MSYKNVIGILGGSGPMAGALLFQNIIAEFQNHHAINDSEFPQIILYNQPLSGFNYSGSSSDDMVKHQVESGLRQLANFGCTHLVIACNTLHRFYSYF